MPFETGDRVTLAYTTPAMNRYLQAQQKQPGTVIRRGRKSIKNTYLVQFDVRDAYKGKYWVFGEYLQRLTEADHADG